MTQEVVKFSVGEAKVTTLVKPRRRNEKFMLRWCEKNIPGFKDARAKALASRNGTIVQGKQK